LPHDVPVVTPLQRSATVSVGGEFRHEVLIGGDLLDVVADRLTTHGFARSTRILLVVDRNVTAHADRLGASLVRAGHPTSCVVLDADESRKSQAAVEAIWSAALAAGLTRHDLIAAVGGGLVGDVAGFAAATYLRGVRWIALPTTLLAMVDASTGGKTGINLTLPNGDLGKNLAGSFWPPLEVVADPATLATLPAREFRSGLAECIKHAVIDSESHVAWLEAALPEILVAASGTDRQALSVLAELVRRSVGVKAKVVTQDPREAGLRAVLNLGHTFGHALETDPALDLTHGEAVAIGMVAAATVGQLLRGFPAVQADRLVRLLMAAGLPTRVPATTSLSAVEHRMGFDKKSQGGQVRFVIPEAFGQVQPKVEVPPRLVRQALLDVGCVA
jgi:3-dehydroquinate synthase